MECYSLSVESGHGHDLNVSLFERLVVSGFPHVTLGVQHRMHPEISAIVRSCTYPQLQDHASVHQHPPLLGVQGGRRLLFLDHDVPEEQEKAGWGNYSFKSKASDGVWGSRSFRAQGLGLGETLTSSHRSLLVCRAPTLSTLFRAAGLCPHTVHNFLCR